jgi:cyclophilin family peptidyl-prolyl cis-trans isomerase
MAKIPVKFTTSKGEFALELDEDKAPITVRNFLSYLDRGFFDGTIFHRVIPGFMIQGGGFVPGMEQKKSDASIKNESANALSNKRGTIAMARTMDPDSASCQFFINLVDNDGLDRSNDTPRGAGYCVFGSVVSGMETVDAIARVPTGMRPPHGDVPKEDVVVVQAKRA